MFCFSEVALSDLSLHAFSPAEVTKLEGDVLAALNFSLHFVTPFDFLLHALARPAVTPEEFFLSLVGLAKLPHALVFLGV